MDVCMCIEKKMCVQMNFQCIYQAIGRINITHGINHFQLEETCTYI